MRLLFVITLNEKFYFKVGEIELDESYFDTRRVRGNAIKFSRIEREMGVAHMEKFSFPLNAGILDNYPGC